MTLDQLRRLQELDSQIDTERDRIATIEAMVRDRSEYELAQRRRQETTQPVKTLQAEQQDLELQIGTARRQLGEVETRLFGGTVNSPRELGDLQRRGEDLRRQIRAGEERELAVMEQLEGATAEATEAEETLRRVVAERRVLETDLLAERKTLAASARSAQTEREGVRAAIDAANLRLYDRLRTTRGGQAVAEVRQRTCQGCRVTLTAALEQRLRQGGQIVICQSCGRFLYLAT